MKAFVKLFLLLFVLVNITKAQVILPMGMGQKNSLNITCSDGDKMWVVNNEDDKFTVNKWDGSFWIGYPEIPVEILNAVSTAPNSLEAKAVYYYKNELYLALANKFNDKLLLIKSSGKKWDAISTTDIKVSQHLTFLSTNDALLLCGKIASGTQQVSILKINLSNCEIYAGLTANHSANDFFTDFEYNDGAVWAYGQFTVNQESRYFAKLENGNWIVVSLLKAPPFPNGNISIGKFNERLVMAGVNFDGVSSFSIEETDGSWKERSNGLADWKINSISDLRQIGQKFWAAGQFTNTKTNKMASLAYWDGIKWTVPNFDFNYLGNDLKLNGRDQVIISGSFVNYQGLLLNHTGILDFGNAIIAGKVFNDLNENCTQDIGENSTAGVMIRLTPEDIYTLTDYNGRYYFPIDSNPQKPHWLILEIPRYQKATCPSIKKAEIVNSQLSIAGNDFGIKTDGLVHRDVSTSVNDFTGWRARQGFEETYIICAENKGTQKIESGKLVFKSDARLSNWVFSEQPEMWQNSTATWNITNLLVGDKYCIKAKVTIPLSIPLESEILFDAQINIGDLQDEDMSNNTNILKQRIVAAIDPNDKTTKQGYYIPETTSIINYKIRFQNTGNDTAQNVELRDTLDLNLILGSQVEIDPSHKGVKTSLVNTRLPNGNYLRVFSWLFENILLPDSQTNEEASHGYLNFDCNLSPKAPLRLGTTIRNTAYIYFDFQEAIITNTAKNLVSNEVSIKPALPTSQLSIYPNPANDYIYISNPLKSSFRINIINSLGQIVSSKTIAADSKLSIPTATMVKGLYIIQAEGYAPVKIIVN